MDKYQPNNIYNVDCYEALKDLPDKSIDLILTDPPYGINADYGVGGYGASANTARHYEKGWDNQTPNQEIFNEILRVGKKIIIFGANYFTNKLPCNGHWIVWDKTSNISFKNPFSDCELAWTNIPKQIVKKYICVQQGFINEDKSQERIHPTQKPLKLFKKIIEDYTNENDLVLDCFLGSGTTAVAAKETGRRYIGFEIDKHYFEIAQDRINGISQKDKKLKEKGIMNLFDFME